MHMFACQATISIECEANWIPPLHRAPKCVIYTIRCDERVHNKKPKHPETTAVIETRLRSVKVSLRLYYLIIRQTNAEQPL